jgi:hypothetical protein
VNVVHRNVAFLQGCLFLFPLVSWSNFVQRSQRIHW